MISLFRKKKPPGEDLKFADIDGKPLLRVILCCHCVMISAVVVSLKPIQGWPTNLLKCRQINWTKMIDAATKSQKVRREA